MKGCIWKDNNEEQSLEEDKTNVVCTEHQDRLRLISITREKKYIMLVYITIPKDLQSVTYSTLFQSRTKT